MIDNNQIQLPLSGFIVIDSVSLLVYDGESLLNRPPACKKKRSENKTKLLDK